MDINSENAAAVAVEVKRVAAAFAVPFAGDDVKVRAAMVKNNRALALHYIDARCVMDRLDEVVGIDGWRDEYTHLPSGEVECRLSVRLAGQWITKADVGSQSEQPDEGDRVKAAVSDALKRAAVKWGIGRHLYRIPQQWMDYDPVKKCIVRPGAAKAKQPGSAAQPAMAARQHYDPRLDAVKSRADLGPIWKDFDADVKAGKVTDADKAHIDARFRELGKRFPAQQTA